MSVISSVWWRRPAGAFASCVIPPGDANEQANLSSVVSSTFGSLGRRTRKNGGSGGQAESGHQAGRLSPHARRMAGQVRQQPVADGRQRGTETPDAVRA